MDVTLDLDAFIANIEGTAPEEEVDSNVPRCQECGAILEEIEGDFICPECNVQATNILQLEETEVQYTEDGRAIAGQRVSLAVKKKKQLDYGWAWSTDEAIVHILGLQVKALKQLGLVDENFCKGIKNMWHDFWVKFVAPHIRDEYNESDYVPISVKNALKLRDIEILYKIKDKVMVPTKQVQTKKKSCRSYAMMGTQFRRHDKSDTSCTDSDTRSVNSDDIELNSVTLDDTQIDCRDGSNIHSDMEIVVTNPKIGRRSLTNRCNSASISILTLNRTLAFIEATARCVEMYSPLFASDIVRACSQRIIPFFGVHKTLPKNMKLNQLDKLMFQKNKPPSPVELTRASTALLKKIYCEKLPFRLPIPSLRSILDRFIFDMNLPNDLMNFIDERVTFHSFSKSTTKLEFTQKSRKDNPQFDRLAFAILMIHLKRLFVFDDENIHKISDMTKERATQTGKNLFVVSDWIRHMSIKLDLILTYDAFSLYHPLAEVKNIRPTPQLYKFLEQSYEDKVITDVRVSANKYPMRDREYREELVDFLQNQVPKPKQFKMDQCIDEELEKPRDFLHPIQDAYDRSMRFWSKEVGKEKEMVDLMAQNFRDQQVVSIEQNVTWCTDDNDSESGSGKKMINLDWPHSFQLLLAVGAYICYCESRDLLQEYKLVEKYLYATCRTTRDEISPRLIQDTIPCVRTEKSPEVVRPRHIVPGVDFEWMPLL